MHTSAPALGGNNPAVVSHANAKETKAQSIAKTAQTTPAPAISSTTPAVTQSAAAPGGNVSTETEETPTPIESKGTGVNGAVTAANPPAESKDV